MRREKLKRVADEAVSQQEAAEQAKVAAEQERNKMKEEVK
jgi:hypothetical protein